MNRWPILLLALATTTGISRAQRIDCTQSAFEGAIAAANSGGGGVTITFNCTDSVILLDSSRDSNRLLTANNVTIDGENRNIRFQMNPPWWDDRTDACGGSNCDPDGNGVPDSCPDVEGAARFLRVQGNNVTIRNVAVNFFWDGIQLGRNGGTNQVVENVSCDLPGDDCISNPTNTGGQLYIRNSKFTRACDKALQLYGRTVTQNSGIDVTVEGNTFENCQQPIHAPYEGGRYLVRNNLIRAQNPSGMFDCTSPRFDGPSGTVLYFEDNLVENCRRGLRIGGGVQAIATGNTFRNNALRGAAVYGSATASFESNTFDGNGGSSSSESYYGGIAAAQSAVVDAGGGSLTLDGAVRSSSGNNTFHGNRSPSDSTVDVSNASGSTVKAESNWWSDVDPSDQVSGDVDYLPFLTGPPSSGDGDPPESVQLLRRLDRR